MATVLSNIVKEYSDGSKFNIRDTTRGWGDTYAVADIIAESIIISSSLLDEDITYAMSDAEFLEYLSADGLDITAEELGIGSYFTDGYYEIKLNLGLSVSPSNDYYINKAGFLEEHKNRVLDMYETFDYPDYDISKENDKFIALALLDSAQAAADRGDYTIFEYIITKVNKIFSNYQLESLW